MCRANVCSGSQGEYRLLALLLSASFTFCCKKLELHKNPLNYLGSSDP